MSSSCYYSPSSHYSLSEISLHFFFASYTLFRVCWVILFYFFAKKFFFAVLKVILLRNVWLKHQSKGMRSKIVTDLNILILKKREKWVTKISKYWKLSGYQFGIDLLVFDERHVWHKFEGWWKVFVEECRLRLYFRSFWINLKAFIKEVYESSTSKKL